LCRDGFRLPSPVWEITLKDDSAGDPLIAPSAITALGLMDSATLEDLWAANDQVMRALHDMFSARGLDLWDIKIEWGLDENGRPLLIDEISPGCCRAFKKGSRERAVGLELAEYFTRSK
jgi:phosphoribosylaminoimidazole-succinocarboxamide synthase